MTNREFFELILGSNATNDIKDYAREEIAKLDTRKEKRNKNEEITDRQNNKKGDSYKN